MPIQKVPKPGPGATAGGGDPERGRGGPGGRIYIDFNKTPTAVLELLRIQITTTEGKVKAISKSEITLLQYCSWAVSAKILDKRNERGFEFSPPHLIHRARQYPSRAEYTRPSHDPWIFQDFKQTIIVRYQYLLKLQLCLSFDSYPLQVSLTLGKEKRRCYIASLESHAHISLLSLMADRIAEGFYNLWCVRFFDCINEMTLAKSTVVHQWAKRNVVVASLKSSIEWQDE